MTLDEWNAEGERRFGPDKMKWRFVCPSCGHVASVEDWKNAGAPEGAVAFSCIGRYTGAGGENFGKLNGGPCNYAGGGLFKLNPVQVDGGEEPGSEYKIFDFADPPAAAVDPASAPRPASRRRSAKRSGAPLPQGDN